VYQTLEIGDEWNTVKCTLQKIFITLAILEEFLVNSLLHCTRIPTVDVKVLVYSNIKKLFLLHFTFPSVGARFKKWRCYMHTFPSPKNLGPFLCGRSQKHKNKRSASQWWGLIGGALTWVGGPANPRD
jgi:hypothetical protein